MMTVMLKLIGRVLLFLAIVAALAITIVPRFLDRGPAKAGAQGHTGYRP